MKFESRSLTDQKCFIFLVFSLVFLIFILGGHVIFLSLGFPIILRLLPSHINFIKFYSLFILYFLTLFITFLQFIIIKIFYIQIDASWNNMWNIFILIRIGSTILFFFCFILIVIRKCLLLWLQYWPKRFSRLQQRKKK